MESESSVEAIAVYVAAIRLLAWSIRRVAKLQEVEFLVLYTNKSLEDKTRFLELLRGDGLTPIYASLDDIKTSDNVELPVRSYVRGDNEHDDDWLEKEVFESWWAKFHLWKYTQFDKIVFLDADMLVLNNIEKLFFVAGDVQPLMSAKMALKKNTNKCRSKGLL